MFKWAVFIAIERLSILNDDIRTINDLAYQVRHYPWLGQNLDIDCYNYRLISVAKLLSSGRSESSEANLDISSFSDVKVVCNLDASINDFNRIYVEASDKFKRFNKCSSLISDFYLDAIFSFCFWFNFDFLLIEAN